MSQNLRFGEGQHVFTLLAPADVVATATKTGFVDLRGANWATLAIQFGAITCDAAVILVKASTAASTVSATEINFNYRLVSVAGTDTIGAITAGTTAGASIAAASQNSIVLVDVDPAVVQAQGADKRFIHALITPGLDGTACVVGAMAVIEPRYPGAMLSS